MRTIDHAEVRACRPEPGWRPRLHLGTLRAVAAVTRAPRHRGFGTAVALLGRTCRPPAPTCTFAIGAGALPVRLADRYWMRLLLASWRYEPEVAAVLDAALDDTTLFVDGGANVGYWSVFALGRVGDRRSIAVEASPATHAWLTRTAAANGDRFVPVHAALWERGGEVLSLDFDPRRHGRASVGESAGLTTTAAGDTQRVATATLDELVAAHRRPGERVVVKLDVEGAEVPALRGAAGLLADGALVIYEDHGSDRSHRVTRHLLEEVGVPVARWDPGRERLVPVRRVDELDAVKVHRWKGYNLVAGDLTPVASLLADGADQPAALGVRSTNSRLL